MNQIKFLLNRQLTDLQKVNWISFFRYNATLFDKISQKEKEDFVRQYIDFIDISFSFAAQVCKVSKNFIRQFANKWNDNDLFYSVEPKDAPQFSYKCKDWLRMEVFLGDFDQQFLDRYKEEILWTELLQQKEFSIQFLEKNVDYFTVLDRENPNWQLWRSISYYQNLTDQFIQKYEDYLDWEMISCSQALSENIMLKYMDKLEWGVVQQNAKTYITYPVQRELKKRGLM